MARETMSPAKAERAIQYSAAPSGGKTVPKSLLREGTLLCR